MKTNFRYAAPEYREAPYWWEETDLLGTCEPASAVPESIDVAVIGGGYTGLSAALTLARGGRSVAVLDSETPGFGCSSRNGGLIGPSFHKLGLQGLKAKYGEGKAIEILRESLDSLNFLVDFIDREKIDCNLQRTGRFRGAIHPTHYDKLAREIENLSKVIDFTAEMVTRSEQRAEIGSDAYHGGAVYHLDGHLHPGKFAAGQARLAHDAGARLFVGTRVKGVDRDGSGYAVQLAGGVVRARDVLIATNGYTDKGFQQFRRRVLPLRSAIIATEPLSDEVVREISPKNRGFGETSRLIVYYRLSPDGKRMIFGGRTFNQADRPESYRVDLYKKMTHIFPQLLGTKISHAWSGTVAYTFDHAPHLGQMDGLWYAMGYCGSGVGRATYFGRKIGLKILGHEEGRTSLDGLPFEGPRLYSGNPWFIPALIRWHALADSMGL